MNFNYKLTFCFVFFLILFTRLYSQNKPLDLLSPNVEIKVSITVSDKIYYSLSGNGTELLTNNHLMIGLTNETLGQNPKLITAKKAKGSEDIKSIKIVRNGGWAAIIEPR